MIKLDSVSEQTEQGLKPCPFCGAEIKHRINIVNFFECNSCGACISFTGSKQIMRGVYEAKDPIANYNRRSGNG